MKIATAIHAIVLIIGISLLVLGVKSFVNSRKFISDGNKVEATVIENIPSRSNKGSIMYTPLIEYNIKGNTKNFSPNARANPPAYNIGEKIMLVYQPENAKDVRILSYWGVYLGSNILLAIGLPMLLIGGGYFLFKMGII